VSTSVGVLTDSLRTLRGGCQTTRLSIACLEAQVGLQGSLQSHSIFDELLRCPMLASSPYLTGGTSAAYSSLLRKKRHAESGDYCSRPDNRVCRCVKRCHQFFNLELCRVPTVPEPTLRRGKPLCEGSWAYV